MAGPLTPVELELMCQAEAIRRMAVAFKQLYGLLEQPEMWDHVVNASWPESPRWHGVMLDPAGEAAVARWKARVAEILGAEPDNDTDANTTA